MNRQILRTLLCAIFLLLASGDAGQALSVFLSGPGVVNNYPPNNVISMRVMTTTTSETTVTWGLQGAGGLSYLMGTIPIPANQHVGFGSAALPGAFPPGVYTLYANEAGTIALGPSMAMEAGKPALRRLLFGLLVAERDPARRERLEHLIKLAEE